MKAFAVISVLVLLACLIGVGYVYMTAHIVVEGVGVVATEAVNQPETFADVKEQIASGQVLGTAYVAPTELSSPEDYQFLTYTVRLTNNCFVTADMVEVQITPMTGDVMQLASETPKVIKSRETDDIHATILTDASMHPVREITVSYYIWGMPFTLRTTYGY
ncbi:MAG: hypothetical protein E7333_00005 [Clostridiales bacterium]|nr:hypothetical protein [Clostridiales bacterium]